MTLMDVVILVPLDHGWLLLLFGTFFHFSISTVNMSHKNAEVKSKKPFFQKNWQTALFLAWFKVRKGQKQEMQGILCRPINIGGRSRASSRQAGHYPTRRGTIPLDGALSRREIVRGDWFDGCRTPGEKPLRRSKVIHGVALRWDRAEMPARRDRGQNSLPPEPKRSRRRR
jgi:hypothetical protein